MYFINNNNKYTNQVHIVRYDHYDLIVLVERLLHPNLDSLLQPLLSSLHIVHRLYILICGIDSAYVATLFLFTSLFSPF